MLEIAAIVLLWRPLISKKATYILGSPFVAEIVERVNRIHSRRINLRNPRRSSAVLADYRGSSGHSDIPTLFNAISELARSHLMRFSSMIVNLIAIYLPKFMRFIFARRFISRYLTFISRIFCGCILRIYLFYSVVQEPFTSSRKYFSIHARERTIH